MINFPMRPVESHCWSRVPGFSGDMKWPMRIVGCIAALAAARAAEPGFTQSLPAADFASAGLNKLTPAELARLDVLVRQFKPDVASPRPAARPAIARDASEAERAPTPTQRSSAAAERTLTVAPGTKVEYGHVESRIAGEFTGWEGRTVFTLENGQRWQTDGSTSYVGVRLQNPAVKIVPGMLGSFWMSIEGVRQRVKVTPIGTR